MSLSKELLYLVLQFCDEEDLKKTAHMLEQETGLFFDMNYFEDQVLSGIWDEAERYLSGFTKLEDDKYSMKIYFEIRKQKFLEALDECDRARALNILRKDLKVFASSNEDLYKEMTQLLTLDDFREHDSLSFYGDTRSARKCMMSELKIIIEANPLFHGKLKFPDINNSRLRRLINQSLNWQHIHCTYPQPNPDIETLFTDHQCSLPDHPNFQSIENNLLPSEATSISTSPLSGNITSDRSIVTQLVISDEAINLGAPTIQDATSERDEDSDNTSKARSTLDEVVSPITFAGQSNSLELNIPDDLPKSVGRILNEDSSPKSMDFHPVQQTFLLVGTDVGHVGLWEVISGAKLFSSKFSVQKTNTKSTTFLEALLKDPYVSVNRILWSPDGSLFGVAYSKHIVQLYSYHGGRNIRKQLEIDAHVGGVNDLAFSRPNEELLVITCGDDKLIQVWDVTTGAKQYTFQGHEAPVYSVCAHVKERIHFLFSMSTNGEIKAWLYDDMGSRVTYDAPGHCCARMAYSADGKRLFSCGTTKDGESYFVEWDESEGYVKRTYQGLQNCSSDVVQFDTSNNQFLAAGDDHLIKIWDMDHVGLLTIINADGGLPASPYVRFNTKGTFLAVFADHNRIKILANDDGLQLLQTSEYNSDNAHGVLSEILRKLANNPIPTATGAGVTDEGVLLVGSMGEDGDSSNSVDESPELAAEPDDILEVKNFSEVNKPSQCQSLRLPSEVKTNKILRLIYTNAGNAILALASNRSHLLWKWSKDETNLSGKVTTKVLPQLWQPRSGLLMINDFTGINFEEVLSCLSLSKNDSYVVSASGGRISLFNMLSFRTMKSFMPPPPAATCIAFYPHDNNIIAVGMDDSTILIYNIRVDQVISMLKGHSKRITGLAFSNVLDVLVSSGVDAQVVVWDTTVWKKKKSRLLRPSERLPLVVPSNTHVQFHHDQIHFLAVHETHIAIYETTKLECLKQWAIGPFCARISHATFSCDSQLIYASFLDGTVLIFSASDLLLQCEINPTAYLPSDISSSVHPLVVAAHPQNPNQFALGLTDGGVVIFEPLESEAKWGVMPSVDGGSMNRMPMVFPLGCFKGDA